MNLIESEGSEKGWRKMPGRFAEGPRHPGFILPASAVSEQETRQEHFLPQVRENRSRMLPATRAENQFKDSCCRKAAKALQIQPADFLPPQQIGRL
jgi:hypothetical protein